MRSETQHCVPGRPPALHLPSTRDVDAVVLLAPFTSMVDAARHHLPWAPVGALLRHRFDNRAAITRTTAPVLIVHNEDDELVPFRMGEELARLAGPRATLVRGAGGGHNAMGMEMGSETIELVGAWLKERDLSVVHQRVP